MKRKSGEVSLEDYVALKSLKKETDVTDGPRPGACREIPVEDWHNRRIPHDLGTDKCHSNYHKLHVVRSEEGITVKQGKAVGKREVERTSMEAIQADFQKKCCLNGCLTKIGLKSFEVTRKWFWRLTVHNQGSTIKSHRKTIVQNASGDQCVFGGQLICSEAWRIMHGVSRSRYFEYKSKQKFPLDGRQGNSYTTDRQALTTSFFQFVKKTHGDKLPDKEEYLLPSCVDKSGLYKEYKNDFDKPFCKRHFVRVWKREHGDLKTSKGTSFTECKECTIIREARRQNLSKEDHQLIEEQKKAHLLLQRILREKYYKHIRKAISFPEVYLSMIIDNMDQAKTLLPRFPVYHKGDAHLGRIQHHVTGVLSHGDKEAFTFTWTDRLPGDANITINCLLKVFSSILQEKGSLPEVLYLQADNCAKDNKNFILIGFLANLVMRKVFRKIKLSFLMVGHTHEDVDQMFSRFAVGLRNKAVPTLDILHKAMEDAYTPVPKLLHLRDIWDYRQLALDGNTSLTGHSIPHVFRLKLVDDRVCMSTKSWTLQSEPYTTLDITDLAQAFEREPVPVKTACNSKFVDLVRRMTEDIPKWVSNGRLSQEEEMWWADHLEAEGNSEQSLPDIPKASSLPEYQRRNINRTPMPRQVADALSRHIQTLGKKSAKVAMKLRRSTN